MSTMREGVDYIIVTAVCCREWPIAFPGTIGRCGYCKQQPRVIHVPR